MIDGAFLRSTSLPRLQKEAAWIVLGQGIAVVGAMVGIRLLTNVLAPAEYGEIALAMTTATFVQQIALGPLGNASLRFFATAAEEHRLNCFFSALQRMVSASIAALLAMGTILSGFLWAHGRSPLLLLFLAAVFYAVLIGCNSIFDGLQNAARQRVVVAWHQGIGQWVKFSGALACVYYLGARSSVAMFGYCLGAASVLGSQLFCLRRNLLILTLPEAPPKKEEIAAMVCRMWSFTWPFLSWGAFTWAQTASERWALQSFRSTIEVGLYQAVYQIGYYPTSLIMSVVVQLVSPVLFARVGNGEDSCRLQSGRQFTRRLVCLSLSLTVIAALFTMLGHGWVFSLLAAPHYRPVSVYLPMVVLSGGLFATGQMAALEFQSSMKTGVVVPVKIVTAVLAVGLNVLGASHWGLKGVVISGVTVSFIYLVWVLRLGGPVGRDAPRVGLPPEVPGF